MGQQFHFVFLFSYKKFSYKKRVFNKSLLVETKDNTVKENNESKVEGKK